MSQILVQSNIACVEQRSRGFIYQSMHKTTFRFIKYAHTQLHAMDNDKSPVLHQSARALQACLHTRTPSEFQIWSKRHFDSSSSFNVEWLVVDKSKKKMKMKNLTDNEVQRP